MTINQFFERYKYDSDIDLIGFGHNSKLFKAYDDTLNRIVTLKVREVHKGKEGLELKRVSTSNEDLLIHKNIAKHEEYLRFKNQYGTFDYIILPYFFEGNIDELNKKNQLSYSQKDKIARGIILGLQYLHKNDIFGINLKSSNVLLVKGADGNYVPKLTDFDLHFNDYENGLGRNTALLEDLTYLSPEQINGHQGNDKSDLWSLGVVLYELFIGRNPFVDSIENYSESTRLAIINRINDGILHKEVNTIYHVWKEIIVACLVPDHNKRVNSVDVLLNKLTDLSIFEEGEPNKLNLVLDQKDFPLEEKERTEPKAKNYKRLYYLLGSLMIIVFLLLALFKSDLLPKSNIEFIVFEENNNFGYKSKNGRIKIPAKYDHVFEFSEDRAVVGNKFKYGIIDNKGEEVTELKYDEVSTFTEGMARVRKDYKYGFINHSGEEIVPIIYDYADNFKNNFAWVYLNGKYGYINKYNREVVPIKFRYINEFHEGLAPYTNESGKRGFLDTLGNIIVPAKYDYCGHFSEGLAMVGSFSDVRGYVRMGFINKSGKEVISQKYKGVMWTQFSNGRALVFKNNKWGYIDLKGKLVVPQEYDFAREFENGLSIVGYANKFGVIDINGKVIISIKYDEVIQTRYGMFIVKYKDKFSFKDSFGNDINSNKYDDISGIYCEGLLAVGVNGKYGYIDSLGKEAISLNFDYAKEFYEGLAAVERDGKYGYINSNGEQIIPFQFEEAKGFEKGRACVSLNDKYGLINRKGEIVVSCIYDKDIYFTDSGIAAVNLNNKFGFIDLNGNEIIQLKYDEAFGFYGGLARVKTNGYYGFIDINGKEVIPLIYKSAFFFDGIISVLYKNKLFDINARGECIRDCNGIPKNHPRIN